MQELFCFSLIIADVAIFMLQNIVRVNIYVDINYSKASCTADGAKVCTLLQRYSQNRQFVVENSFSGLDIRRVNKNNKSYSHFLLFKQSRIERAIENGSVSHSTGTHMLLIHEE